MNFDLFIDRLNALQRSISIMSPVAMTVKRTYWGAPSGAISDLPAVINTLSEPERTLGMGARREARYRVVVQILVARATPEDERSSRIATAFWFAAKAAFDADRTIGGTVMHAILQGANPTVPVLLQHGGQAYVGLDAVLEIDHIEI